MTIHPAKWLCHNSISAALLAALIVSGCVSTEQIVPPISDHLLTLAQDEGLSIPQLERGRLVYLTDCTKCHSPESVTRYTAMQWKEIMPRMVKQTSLNTNDRAAVEAYVTFILRSESLHSGE
ncbi:MAG: hypothetical protein O7G85_14020 [Planctomycetota bacterium]|nr:hypothetical protein [Planctomycetota bacterium]